MRGVPVGERAFLVFMSGKCTSKELAIKLYQSKNFVDCCIYILLLCMSDIHLNNIPRD